MKEFERLFQAWDLIKEGSVQCTLVQENEMLGLKVTSDCAEIDIKHPDGLELLSLFFKKKVQPKMSTFERIQERRSIILGVLGSFKAKREDLSKQLAVVQEIATIFAENKKCLILKDKGKQIAKLGYGANSLGMRLIKLQHVEVNDLSAVMRLLDKAKLG